jgi:predicted ATPase
VACAIDLQRAVGEAVWPVAVGTLKIRVGVHVGKVDPRAGGEYRGVVINRTARILATAHGGQIVCCAAVAESLAAQVETKELGVFRLRGLPTPERLFQVCWPEMPQKEFPAPNALPAYTNNLPPSFTRFFGRKQEITRLRELLLAHSGSTATGGAASGCLVTLTGPGGTGKTRLSLAVAESLLQEFSHAVWFVPLADLADAELLPATLRESLRLKADPVLEPLEQVVATLAAQPAMIVLDNFEQLGQAGVAFVRTLLARVPSLRCLVTSRQRLGLEGEREFSVPPLSVPPQGGGIERLSDFESVQLFVDRAQAVRSDFSLNERNSGSVAALCRQLEGVPLALELAAARAHVATPREMVESLSKRLDYFAATDSKVPARQRTLRAAIDWSYEFLPAALQQFLANLGVFRGGWTLDAAEAVAVPEGLAGVSASPLRALGELRAASLIVSEEVEERMRFRMLETLRCYAEERLAASGNMPEVREKHVTFFAKLADQAETGDPAQRPDLFRRLALEHDNLRAALDAPRCGDKQLEMAASLVIFWMTRRHDTEGRSYLARLRAQCADADPFALAAAHNAEGILAWTSGDLVAARAAFEATLAHFRKVEISRTSQQR